MDFYINEKYLTSITVEEVWLDGKKDISEEEEIILKLQGKGEYTSTESVDHPVFNDLRNELEQKGFITVQRNWWNGDEVIKPFKLNDKQFIKGERFVCATAMRWQLVHK